MRRVGSNCRKLSGTGTALCASFILVLVSACATVATVPPEGEVLILAGVLPVENDIYLFADVDANRNLFEGLTSSWGLEKRDADRVLNGTRFILLSLDELGREDERFTMIATGNYPAKVISFGLFSGSDWQRRKDNLVWYQSKGRPLQIGLPTSNHLLIASAGMEDLVKSWQRSVEEQPKERFKSSFVSLLDNYRGNADGVVYVADLGAFAGIFGEAISRVNGRVLATAISGVEEYEVRFTFFLENPAAFLSLPAKR